jgi:hypothetical protein
MTVPQSGTRLRRTYWRLFRWPRPLTVPVSGPQSPAMTARPASRGAAVPLAPADQDRRGCRRLLVAAGLLRRGRHAIIVLVLTEIAAVASIAACLAALLWQRPGLAALAGAAAALMFAVFLVSRILARRREPRPSPRS